MNKCHFMGRLTRDPEIRYTQTGVPAAIYTLAVDRKIKKQGEQQADFLNFIAYGKSAEFAEKYLKKGTKLVVTARCQARSYENSEGRRIYVTEFIIEDQEFAESKKAAAGDDGSVNAKAAAGDDGFMHVTDDGEELPFD